MPTDRYLSWALDTEADDEREVFLSGIHPLLVDDDLALCEKLERVAAAVQGAVHDDEPPRSCDMGAAPFDEVRLEPSSSDDGGDDDFVDAVRRQCPEDSVSFHHDGDLWAEDGDGPPPEPWLPGLERLTVGVAEGCEEKGGEDSEAGGIGISGEPADMQGSGSDGAGRVLEPMDCVPGHPSALGCFLAPEAVEEVVVPHAAKEAPSGPKDCVSASLEQLPSREKCAVVDNECGDFPLKGPCFEDSLPVEPLVESAADESPRSDTSAGYTLINQLFQEDPLQEDFPQEVSSREGPLLESPPPESLLPRDPSQEGSLQEDGSLKHPARRDPLLGDPCLQPPFSGDPPLEHCFLEDPSLEHPLQGDSSLQHPPPGDSFVRGPFPDYQFLGDPLLEQPLLGHPLLDGPSYFEASTLDKSLQDIPSDDSSLGGTSADDSASESEDASREETWRDESSLETSLLEDDSLESPSLHDVSQETPSPESSSREDLSDDEFCGKPVRGPSTLKVAATPLPPVSMAVSAPFCLAPVYGTASPGLTATPVYFMLLPDGRGSSGMSADKAVACPAPSSQLCSDSRPAPPPSQPAPPGNAWDTMRVLVPLAGRRQAVRRRPALRCGPPQRTYEGAARRAPAAAHRNKQATTRTAQEQWGNAGKKLPQPWEGTVSLPRTPVKTGGPARSNADSAVAKNRWMRRRPAKPEVPLVPRQLARCGRCDVCSKSYKRLDKHMLIHLQLRRYECPVCGLRFTQSEHCKRHQQKHAETMDPLRKCECTVCGKVLSRRDKLKDHERHAHGRHSQPAACD